jgi:hypothetical protein
MALDDLPQPIATFVQALGVEWPNINEGAVWDFSRLMHEFGQAVQGTHEDATAAVGGIAQAYQGPATQQMSSAWSELSVQHFGGLIPAIQTMAQALDGWGAFIVRSKVQAIAELEPLVESFFAAEAAAPETAGASEAEVPLLFAAGRRILEALGQALGQYVVGEVIEKAAKPLSAKMQALAQGFDWSQATQIAAAMKGIALDMDELTTQAAALQGHAATLRSHAANLNAGLAGLQF